MEQPVTTDAARAARTARLDQVRAAAKAAGVTAGLVKLTADERAEFVTADFALEA